MHKIEKIDPETIGTSPFSVNLKILATKVFLNNEFDAPDDEGIVINKSYYAEQGRKTQIYHSAGARDMIINLSDKARLLFMWICFELEPGQDFVQINAAYYMAKCGVKSANTYRAAVAELHRYSFISPTAYKSAFWINPNLIFCGSRVKKYPHNVVSKATFQK